MRFDKISKFRVLPSGEEILKKKIDGKRYEIPYLSRDEYDDLEDPQLIGYTTLKRNSKAIEDEYYKKSDDTVGLLEYYDEIQQPFLNTPISVIRKKIGKFKTVKGYFDVGDNQYVAIEKNSLFLFLIPLLLLILLIGLCASCGGFNNVDPALADPWQPTLEEDLGESPDNKNEQRNIEIFGFSSWHVAAGQTEDIPITLKNPEGNPCYFSFEISLSDSGEVIYRSKMVAPGDTIKSIDINKPLDKGIYTALIHIYTNELDTGNEMNDAQFLVELTVN